MMVGVNGAGKTTTTGKLARRLQENGKTVIMAAADTFRAAAIEQLAVWAERADTDIIRQNQGADPSAVIFDALQAARDAGVAVTDEAQALERLGEHPLLVEGARDNLKITWPEDLQMAEAFLRLQEEAGA